MPKITKLPRWSFWKWHEEYQCEFVGQASAIQAAAVSFYQRQPVEDFAYLTDGFRFWRNRGWRSWITTSEAKLKNEVVVTLEEQQTRVLLTVRYRVALNAPIPNLRIGQSQLFKEVAELESWIQSDGKIRLQSNADNLGDSKAPRARLIVSFFLWGLYRSYRFITWSTFWTKRRFTRLGQAMIGGVVVALFAGLDAESAVGYQAFMPLFALLLLSLFFAFGFRARFQVERHLPRVATAGSPFTYRVSVRNTKRKKELGLTLMEDLTDPRPDFKQWKEYKLDEDKHVRPFQFSKRNFKSPFKMAIVRESPIPGLLPQQENEVTMELTPLRRGVVRFTGVTFARPDPMGIFRALRKHELPQSLLVLPKRYAIPPIALPGSMKYQQGGVAMASHIGQSEEFVSLRDYRRGDPPRHIHWRSWARVGKPIVKEYEDEFFVRHALVLDTFTSRPHSDAFEEAVSVAASFACTILTQESLLDLLFVGPEAFCFTAGRGIAHADQMLEILASVQPCNSQLFDRLEQLVLNHSSTVSGCICVMLAWDDTRKRFVEKLRALGLPVLVMVIRPPGDSHPLDLGPMSDAPEQLRSLEIGRIEEQLALLK